MNEKVIELPEERCQFCGRGATLLCDKVKGTYRFVGHPPKKSLAMSGFHTCDKKICKDCATHIDGADYCPDCVDILRKALR